MERNSEQWWKEQIIYQIYPRSFQDSNGDGIGDLQGIIQRLPYLKELGVTMLWCSPFFKSPNDDNGYDISDYTAIGEEYGMMVDFEQLIDAVKKHDLHIIIDTVLNHSSDEHPWFVESRKSKTNPYSDYYIWRDPKPNGDPPTNWPSFFGGSAWTFDENRQQYYLRLFTSKQPDLNWENPKVREDVKSVLKFWLNKGVDGFRMDVIPLISKRYPLMDVPTDVQFEKMVEDYYSNGPRVHDYLHELNRDVMSNYKAMTMAEGIGITSQLAPLYVDADRQELSTLYHFDHLFLDHGKGGRFDLRQWTLLELKNSILEWDTAIHIGDGSICFSLGNHDFGRLINRYGSTQHRVHSATCLATLVLGLRAIPIIYQGDEFGMTNTHFDKIEEIDDVMTTGGYKEWIAEGRDHDAFMLAANIQSRDHTRTPMQWDDSNGGGFSSAEPWLPMNPNYKQINAQADQRDPNGVLQYYKKLIRIRKSDDALVYGDFNILNKEDPNVFHFVRQSEGTTFHFILNFSDNQQSYNDLNPALGDVILTNYNEISTGLLKPWHAVILRKNEV